VKVSDADSHGQESRFLVCFSAIRRFFNDLTSEAGEIAYAFAASSMAVRSNISHFEVKHPNKSAANFAVRSRSAADAGSIFIGPTTTTSSPRVNDS